MSGGLITGMKYAFAGFGMITKPRLRRFVLIPFLINLLLFGGVLWFGSSWIDFYIDQWLPSWLDWLRFVIWPIMALLAMALIFSTFTLIANLLGAPFNSLLSEAVQTRLSGQKIADNPGLINLVKDVLISIKSELGKIGYFLIRALPLLILFLIPGLNVLAPFLWFLFAAWMLSHEYLDYPLSNRGHTFSEQRKMLKTKRMLVIGFGLAVMIMTLIPVINFFAMPVAVAGATILSHEQFPNW